MPEGALIDPETPIAARIRWGWVSASIPIHVTSWWSFLKDGAVMLAGQETDPMFIGLPLAITASGLLGWGVGPAITAWWTEDTDRFASLVADVRRVRDGLRTTQRLTAEAGGGPTLHRATDVDATGELMAKLQALGVHFGKLSAPTPHDFGRLIDRMERRQLKQACKQWPEGGSNVAEPQPRG